MPGDVGRGPEACLLSVIVVNWNTQDVLRGCLKSVRDHLSEPASETIVIDNGSQDGSAEMVLADFPHVRLIRNAENLGFGPANNQGMAVASGEFFLLLNSDARLVDDTPLRLLELMKKRPQVGVVGPRLVFEGGRLQHSANRFPTLARLAFEELGFYRLLPRERSAHMLLGGYWNHAGEREADWLTGACLLVRRRVWEETGGFDPSMFLYGEEVEWCHRIRERGWVVLYAPVGEVVHLGHVTTRLFLGDAVRIDRCLLAADQLVARREGTAAGVLAGCIRCAGALIKLLAFSLRRLRFGGGDDEYGRNVKRYARVVMAHYARRLAGKLPVAARR
jgi:GT2 family glycosyltransferase